MRLTRLPLLLGVAALLAGCEISGSPSTGEGNVRLGIPGTAANEAIFQERWNSCVQFSSPSVCAKRFGGRTPRGSPVDLPDENP
ncbi:MAG: hypothetical protein U0S49_11300 [Rhodospirillales bacterium]|jgi:hypothetical protein|nr:hypothetical protein [Rhodospirillales bacterium]